LKVFYHSLFNSLYVVEMLDPRGIEGSVNSTEEEVAMDTGSVHSGGSEWEPALQPQVGQSALYLWLFLWGHCNLTSCDR